MHGGTGKYLIRGEGCKSKNRKEAKDGRNKAREEEEECKRKKGKGRNARGD